MAITLQLVTTQWSINLTLIRMSFNKKILQKMKVARSLARTPHLLVEHGTITTVFPFFA